MKDTSYYSNLFSKLKVSKSKELGTANHKPILILSVIDLITRGIITNNQITVSDELINTFDKYWDVIGTKSRKGGLHYPFFHLQSEGFWHIVFKPDYDKLRITTINKLRLGVEYAYLEDELFNLLQNENSRQEIVESLISAWFADNTSEIEKVAQINQDLQDLSSELDICETTNYDAQSKESLKTSIIRNTFFRKAVLHTYEYKCAFCGLKVMKLSKYHIVDGAHIKPFGEFRDSRIKNGISLCKNHHWAFDTGLFTVDEQYKIIISKNFEEESPNAQPMKSFHGKILYLPSLEKFYPELESFEWHRQNKFDK
ncbi:MAG: HNH endonuclease [Calothrix sp. C42_A2020_038]|nr:HNH endonuclease [Calothrix sp. C42_A2020_038]